MKGSNRMLGYLNQPERTAEVFRDGWYITGDIALLDDEGFLRITDRLSRFSKIGGEMVPHLKVEEAILNVARRCCSAWSPASPTTRAASAWWRSTCTPRSRRRTCTGRSAETDLPRLWIPKRENLYPVDALPQLGTGKLDLRGVRNRAQELAGGRRAVVIRTSLQ